LQDNLLQGVVKSVWQ